MNFNPIPAGFHTIAPTSSLKALMKQCLSTNELLALRKSCVYQCPMEKWFTVS
jgi:hypothetical protein